MRKTSLDLPRHRTEHDVASALGTTVDELRRLLEDQVRKDCYTAIRIPKKRRGIRIVYVVDSDLRRFHRDIHYYLRSRVTFPPYVTGFVPNRSIVDNARLHLNARRILHADIAAFFDSITWNKVVEAFLLVGALPDVAEMLATLCTRDDCLPQGSAASPVLSNLACTALDAQLSRLATTVGAVYSRYVDDITFSGDTVPESTAVAAILRGHGFSLRTPGIRHQRRGRSQYVTGLTVADRGWPRVPRRLKRQLRLELHKAELHGLAKHLAATNKSEDEFRHIEGLLSFIHAVEPLVASKLLKQFNQIIAAHEAARAAASSP